MRIPVSLFWFGLTAAIFVLQWIPITGIFLMFVLAAYWSVITVNLGFVSLGYEAFTRRIPMYWLLAPALWFGGYFALAQLSHQSVDALDTELRRHNATRMVAFDPSQQAVVFDGKGGLLSGVQNMLVQNYGLSLAYETTEHERIAKHHALRLVGGEICKPGVAHRSPSNRVSVTWFHEGDKLVPGMCLLSLPEDPSLPALFVSAKRVPGKSWLAEERQHRIEIQGGAHGTVTLLAGDAAPLSWFPQPIMGCALNSGRPSWDCSMGFGREKRRGIGAAKSWSEADAEVIATSLGLHPLKASSRRAEVSGYEQAVANVAETEPKAALAALDRFLAGQMPRITVHDIRGLGQRPDLYRDRLDAIVAGIVKATTGKKRITENSRNLQTLVAFLPADEFARRGRDVLAILEAQDNLTDDDVSLEMAARVGDLGAPALPVLRKLAFEARSRESNARTMAIVGFCRAGMAAASEAERLAQVLAEDVRFASERHAATFKALLRMGRGDLVDGAPGGAGSHQQKRYEKWRREIGVDSKPGACAREDGWPHLPNG